MAATYPLAVRTFTQKRNLLDDVDASHVNDIQDEIKAIETALGIRPNVDTALNKTYASLSERIRAARAGIEIPAFHLVQTTDTYTLWSRRLDYTNDVVAVQAAQAGDDTHSLADGTGVTLKRDGWYSISASAVFGTNKTDYSRHVSLLVKTGTATTWTRLISDTVRADWAMQGYSTQNGSANATYCAPFRAGTRFAVGVAHDEGSSDLTGTVSVPVRYARLMGHMVRELV